MVSRSLRTRRAISASSTHKMTGRIESGGKGLIWLHPLDETTILHAARELSRSAEYSYIPIGPSRAKPGTRWRVVVEQADSWHQNRPMPLHRHVYREHDSRIALVDQIIPIVGIENVNVVRVIPVSRPVFRPRINHVEPKAAVLKARIPAVHHDRHSVDGKCVARPKVLAVTFFRNAVAMIAASLLPRAVLRLPVLRAMRLPRSLLNMPLFRRRLHFSLMGSGLSFFLVLLLRESRSGCSQQKK